MQLKKIVIDYIVKLWRLELKELFFFYHYNLVLQDKTFYIACQLFFFLFYI